MIEFILEPYDEIMNTIGALPAETGGVLGGDRATGRITHFHFDQTAKCGSTTYTPDVDYLNDRLLPDWNARKIWLMGFAHSHPRFLTCPSGGDVDFAKRILNHNSELQYLFTPIILPGSGTMPAQFFPYIIDGSGKVSPVAIRTGKEAKPLWIDKPPEHQRTIFAVRQLPVAKRPQPVPPHATAATASGAAFQAQARFQRVTGAYDIQLLAECRLIVVGCGGSRAHIEEMVRAGIRDLVLIDPDRIEEKNVGTQHVYADEVGLFKVDAVAAAIRRIDPGIRIDARPVALDDIDDAAFKQLLYQPLAGSARPPNHKRVLLAGYTDEFAAQARINRLGLQFGISTLCAQVYREGRGAEITFTAPGITPACHRCILSSRYAAYAEGYRNDVGSQATPIMSTSRLNALKGFLALALLHRDSGHPRWDALLARIGNRNLVQLRLDPDLATILGLDIFDKVLGPADQGRLLFDDTVWLPQDADHPNRNGCATCSDCRGTGDLRNAIRAFQDTRLMSGGRAIPEEEPVF